MTTPDNTDLTEVHALSSRVAQLEQELELARLQLRDAWARVPFDPDVLRRPWKSDVPATCRACGKPTLWRTARGLAEHMPVCPSDVRIPKISADIWAILSGETPVEESLDDD